MTTFSLTRWFLLRFGLWWFGNIYLLLFLLRKLTKISQSSVVQGKSKKLAGFISFLCTLFFLNHFVYLSFNTFDYTYNMKVNIFTGAVGGVGWLMWGLSQIRKRRYVWRLIIFVALALSTVALEIYDFPPIFWLFDSHALWHLSSAPITILFYK